MEARDCSEKDLLGHANKTSHGPDLTGLGVLRDCPGADIGTTVSLNAQNYSI